MAISVGENWEKCETDPGRNKLQYSFFELQREIEDTLKRVPEITVGGKSRHLARQFDAHEATRNVGRQGGGGNAITP